jgi:DNA repair protein RecO (recombination protein O)
VAGRTRKTEAVILRSLRFAEADRILHLYTLDRGRVGAIAKGARRTASRFGARLEPLSHVELLLHQGSGELGTVTGVELIRSHQGVRDDPHRLGVGLIGAETMLRLFPEQEANPRAFEALTRFLDLLDERPGHLASPPRPQLDPLGLAFQLKLLWLAGYYPHLERCTECGSQAPLVGYSARAGGAVCDACARAAGVLVLSRNALLGMEALLRRPLAAATDVELTDRGVREILAVITTSFEHHVGFRLKTLSA